MVAEPLTGLGSMQLANEQLHPCSRLQILTQVDVVLMKTSRRFLALEFWLQKPLLAPRHISNVSNMVEKNPWWRNVAGPFPKWEGPIGCKEDGGGSHRGRGTVGKMLIHRAVNIHYKEGDLLHRSSFAEDRCLFGKRPSAFHLHTVCLQASQ